MNTGNCKHTIIVQLNLYQFHLIYCTLHLHEKQNVRSFSLTKWERTVTAQGFLSPGSSNSRQSLCSLGLNGNRRRCACFCMLPFFNNLILCLTNHHEALGNASPFLLICLFNHWTTQWRLTPLVCNKYKFITLIILGENIASTYLIMKLISI